MNMEGGIKVQVGKRVAMEGVASGQVLRVGELLQSSLSLHTHISTINQIDQSMKKHI